MTTKTRRDYYTISAKGERERRRERGFVQSLLSTAVAELIDSSSQPKFLGKRKVFEEQRICLILTYII